MRILVRGARRVAVVVAAAGLFGACYEFTGPAPAPDLLLTGSWATVCCIPSGSQTVFTMRAAGGSITGAGDEYRLCCYHDSFAITGEYSGNPPWYSLTFEYSKGPTATFVGQALGVDSLVGSWTSSEFPGTHRAAFYRQAEPPCADSVPLLGTYDPRAPGYIVRFQDSVDAVTEAARLAERYGFVTTFVYKVAIKGFAAPLSPATVAVLRCEPKVTSVSHDAVATVG
jgi:hypothetical protein